MAKAAVWYKDFDMNNIRIRDDGKFIDISRNIFEHRETIGRHFWVYMTMLLHPDYNDLLIANELDMQIEDVVVSISKLRDMGYVEYAEGFHCKIPRNRITPKEIRKMINSKNASCAYCGSKKNLEIDHIKPVSKGGGNNIENLQILCRKCNKAKGDRQ